MTPFPPAGSHAELGSLPCKDSAEMPWRIEWDDEGGDDG